MFNTTVMLVDEATLQSVSPTAIVSIGGNVTVIGSGFINTSQYAAMCMDCSLCRIACKFYDLSLVPATFSSATTVRCVAPASVPGDKQLAVSNYGVFLQPKTSAIVEYYGTNL